MDGSWDNDVHWKDEMNVNALCNGEQGIERCILDMFKVKNKQFWGKKKQRINAYVDREYQICTRNRGYVTLVHSSEVSSFPQQLKR